MNLYSHLVMARVVEPLLLPEDPDEFAWGVVFPDIRYLAGFPRERTHVPIEQVDAWIECYPALRDWLLGYRAHLLADQIDLVRQINRELPEHWKWLRRYLTQRRAAVFIEYAMLRQRGVEWLVSGSYNEVMEELGVTPEHVALYAPPINAYIATASLQSALDGFRSMSMLADGHIEDYLRIIQQVDRLPLLQELVVRLARPDHLVEVMQTITCQPRPLPVPIDWETELGGEYESPLEI